MRISDKRFDLRRVTEAAVAAQILNQYTDLFPGWESSPEQNARIAQKLAAHGVIMAAFREDEVICFMGGYANDLTNRKAFCSFLAVKPNLGLLSGYVVLKTAMAFGHYAKEQGMERMAIEVEDINTHARQLYEKAGFQYTGRASDHSQYMEILLDDFLKIERK